jgi:hypothetical protein
MRAHRSPSAAALIAVVVAATLLLAACPPPVMREVLVYAQDKIPPVITVTAPANRSPFDSTVTFIGVVTDAAVAAGDGHGKVASLAYTVVDHESLGGTAELTADGAFSFTIDTRGLTGDQAVVITATDWIGNSSTARVEVVDPGVGPDITVSSPQASSVYLSTVAVTGVVNNRGDSVDVGEVAGLRYEILGSSVQGDVTFSAADGSFSFSFSTVTLRSRITIRLTATDKNGRTSTADVELLDRSDGPTLTISSPQPYSSFQAAVTLTGTVTNNGDPTSTTEVQSLSYQVLGKTAVTAVAFAADTGAFAFGFSTVGMTGNIIVQISAKDKNNRSTVVDFSLLEDKGGPYIIIDPPLDGTNYPITIALKGEVRNSEGDLTHFDDVDATTVAYRIGTGDPVRLALDTAGAFSVSISTIGKSGTLLLKVTATDLNGHVTEKTITMLDNLPGPVVTVTSIPQYYSSAVSPQVAVAGTVSAPSNLLGGRMAYRVQHAGTLYEAYVTVIDGAGNFTFSFAPLASGISGNLTVTIVATDTGGRVTEKSVFVTDDTQRPRMLGSALASNSYVDLFFTKPVFTSPDGTGGLVPGDVRPQFAQNGGGATGVTITSLTRIDGNPLAGGEDTVRAHLSYTGTPSGVETLAFYPNDGASIYDHVGNAVASTENSTTLALKDQAAPWAQSIAAETPNGVYNAPDAIDLVVIFSEPVTVSIAGGAPYLTLETGTTDRAASYQSSIGPNSLRFRYIVQPGDYSADLDCAAGSTIAVPAGSAIRDTSGNDASTAIPASPGLGSLVYNSDIRIDTDVSAPTQPVLDPASDTGTIGDGRTSDTTPTFSVTVSEAGTIRLYRAGTIEIGSATAAAAAAYNVTSAVLPAGNHLVTAKLTDLAGNTSAASVAAALSVDTAASTPDQPVLSATTDSGNLGDNITNYTAPVFSVTVAEPGTIRLYRAGTVEIGSAAASGFGSYDVASSTLSAGSHTISAKLTDSAGNVSGASLGLTITVDTSVSAPGAPALASTSDSGTVGDSITNVTTPTFSVTVPEGGTVRIYEGTTLLGSATAGASGTYNVASSTLSGTDTGTLHTITAELTDVAANTSAASPAVVLNVDIGAQPPGTPVLTPASDSLPTGDNITSYTTLTLAVTVYEGGTITLYDAGAEIGTTAAGASGTYNCTTPVLATGSHTFTAKLTDVAGNVSGASGLLTVTITP